MPFMDASIGKFMLLCLQELFYYRIVLFNILRFNTERRFAANDVLYIITQKEQIFNKKTGQYNRCN